MLPLVVSVTWKLVQNCDKNLPRMETGIGRCLQTKETSAKAIEEKSSRNHRTIASL